MILPEIKTPNLPKIGIRRQPVIEYLVEENRVLDEPIGNERMRFTDDQRRRLTANARELGRKLLAQVATIVTPETLMAWHRKLIAQKYDGTSFRQPKNSRRNHGAHGRITTENSGWGYCRIQGAMANLDHCWLTFNSGNFAARSVFSVDSNYAVYTMTH